MFVGRTAAITRVGEGEFPFEIRHRRQLGWIALLERTLQHWSRATAIESVFRNQCTKQNVPYSRANLNPAFGGLTAQLRFPILPESRLGVRSKGGERVLRFFSAGKNAETRAVVQPNSTSFAACETVNPAATSCHCRPVTRNSSVLIRVIRGFKMRFISVRTNSMSTREASCLQVLTAAVTGPPPRNFDFKTRVIGGSR